MRPTVTQEDVLHRGTASFVSLGIDELLLWSTISFDDVTINASTGSGRARFFCEITKQEDF